MIKTKKKGSRLELKTKEIIEQMGYLVTKSGGSLGVFDLMRVLFPAASRIVETFISNPQKKGN